jgi:hypothetical protein
MSKLIDFEFALSTAMTPVNNTILGQNVSSGSNNLFMIVTICVNHLLLSDFTV